MSCGTCAACGGRLPESSWMTEICDAGCVDALVDAWAGHETTVAGALDAFVATA